MVTLRARKRWVLLDHGLAALVWSGLTWGEQVLIFGVTLFGILLVPLACRLCAWGTARPGSTLSLY